jgi:hypothetical protein
MNAMLRDCGIDPHTPKIARKPRNPVGSGRLREYDAAEDDIQAVAVVLFHYVSLRCARLTESGKAETLITSSEIRERFPWIQARGAISTIDAAIATLAMDRRLGLTFRCAGDRGGRWIVELSA